MRSTDLRKRLVVLGDEGQEIFEISPVLLGGVLTDAKNKTVLSREDHIKAVAYWGYGDSALN